MVHAVTDDRVLALPDFLERAAALAGVPGCAIHVRGRLPANRLLGLGDAVRTLTAAAGTALIIHDRLDLAMLCHADGAHLPGAGIPASHARALLGPDVLIGRSTHSPAEARAAADAGSDYVFLGNIWETPSHPGRPGIGPDAIRAAPPARTIAIGGITAETAPAAIRAGAAGCAAVRALWDAPDPAAAAHAFRVLFPG
ncbi:MAG: thiamine phosphate synthase [Gemmatimonadota bacterium]|nr:thiamine phosphate synthase [Gemmatimonadota bacterium]MDH4349714.1 thiamine phosphate synthase [Gemmatimonadota bacterium]